MSEELYFIKSIKGKRGELAHQQKVLESLSKRFESNQDEIDFKDLAKKLTNGKKRLSLQEVEFLFNGTLHLEDNAVFNLLETEFIELLNTKLQKFHLYLFWSLLEKSKVRAFWDLIHEYENISDNFFNEVYTQEEFNSLLNFVLSYACLISQFLFIHYYEKDTYEESANKNLKLLNHLELDDFENYNKAKQYFDQQSFEFLKDLQGIKELVAYRNKHAAESPLIIPSHLQRSESRESLLVQLSDLVWIADRLKSLNNQIDGTVYLIHHY